MVNDKRQNDRQPVDFEVALYWENAAGQICCSRPRARDLSETGMGLDLDVELELSTRVFMDSPHTGSAIEAVVRYCMANRERTRSSDGRSDFRMGVEFVSTGKASNQPAPEGVDCYEVLQLSPNADFETIHRVYRIMAGRYHPDNQESGDEQKFILITRAYKVLSDPQQRSAYDAFRRTGRPRALPVFQSGIFVDEKKGEASRRLGILCLLYSQRRSDDDHPGISLLDLEELMSIPREYLKFTLWYLKKKQYIEVEQDSTFTLTELGVDFVEEHTPAQTMLHRLLQNRNSGEEGQSQPRADSTL
jgi:hypothetical protein